MATIDVSALAQWPLARVGNNFAVDIPFTLAPGETITEVKRNFPSAQWAHANPVGGLLRITGVPTLEGVFDLSFEMRTSAGNFLVAPSGGTAIQALAANAQPVNTAQQLVGFKTVTLEPGQRMEVAVEGVVDPDLGVENTDPAESLQVLMSIAGRQVGIAPSISSTPPVTTNIQEACVYQAQASGTAPVAWAMVAGPDNMSIHPSTGQLQWTPQTPEVVQAIIRASNLAGHDDQAFSIQAVAVVPAITSDPYSGTGGPLALNAGLQQHVYNITADGSLPITFAIDNLAGNDWITNGGTAQIVNNVLTLFTPTVAGNYSLVISATSPYGVATQTIDITVS